MKRSGSSFVFASVLAAALGWTAVASAVPPQAREDAIRGGGSGADRAEAEPPPRWKRDVELGLGVRMMFMPDTGFGPYASNDVLGQIALTGGLELLRAGRFSLALAAEWDGGGRSAQARGTVSSIFLHRFSGGLEARFALAPRLIGFVKAAPVAVYVHATIEDALVVDRPIEANEWTWGLDATAGGRLLLAGKPQSWARLWLVAEAGYGFAGSTPMRFAPSQEVDDPRDFSPIALPDLRPSGAIARLGLTLGF